MNKLFIVTLIALQGLSAQAQPKLNKKLQQYATSLSAEFVNISGEQKKELEEIGDYILEKAKENKTVSILYICTHNSRRSHLGQVWLQTAAAYYGIQNIQTFSGGTAITAFNIRVADALKRAGFGVAKSTIQISQSENEVPNIPYEISYANDVPPMLVYSKKYTDINNPKNNFLAIMVCSEADRTCPNVEGAELRIAMPYDDPKYYDGTPAETEKYDERCRQIARDQFYIMYYVKQKMILQQEQSKTKNK